MRTDTTEIGVPTVVLHLGEPTMPMPRVTPSDAKCARCDIRLNAIAMPPVPYVKVGESEPRLYHDVCARAEKIKDTGLRLGELRSDPPGTSDPR